MVPRHRPVASILRDFVAPRETTVKGPNSGVALSFRRLLTSKTTLSYILHMMGHILSRNPFQMVIT
jgi:hypothetical protein